VRDSRYMSALHSRRFRIGPRGVVICLGGLAGFLLVYTAAYELARAQRATAENFELCLAVHHFALYFGRMPESFEELVAQGYLCPVEEGGRHAYRLCLSGDSSAPPVTGTSVRASPLKIYDTSSIEFAWGVTPEDLVLRSGRVYYRNEPGKEAILARSKTFWISQLERDRSLRLYKAMLEGAARRSAQSAPTTRSAGPREGKTSDDGGGSSVDGATQR